MSFMKLTKSSFDENFKQMNTTMANLLVGTLAGFIGGNISSCKLQDIINKKQYVNYIILFAMIYVLQGWKGGDNALHPVHKLILSLLAMLYFIMIMRNNYIAIVIGVVLLLVSHEIKYYLDYVDNNDKVNMTDKEQELAENIQKMCEIGGLAAFGVGFIVNFIIKSKSGNFNVLKHLFGKCE